ncbi:ECF transporter S component [Clostridium sp. MSJ-4]|uniref:ECF transporter S component n=1 Tax=Clostridium simiarum TaxID=2841506 RepID=A0ABS6F5N0_9CLOT|nr:MULTISPECIES: ECF transporter S component [Clostridium]MBU5592883.1 ECF transporter S component [Clostridium simiarum]
MERGSRLSQTRTRQLTVVGMLSAICIILGVTGYGFIQLPIAKITIMHIPVIIGAIIEGPKVGMLIGLMFGGFSIIQNIMAPNLLSFAFINPLVSILPRILIPLTSYYSYKLIKIKNESIRIGIGAAIGSLTNTVGVLTMIYILYVDKYATVKNLTIDKATKAIFGVAYTNGILEAIVGVLITISVVGAVNKIKKEKRKDN